MADKAFKSVVCGFYVECCMLCGKTTLTLQFLFYSEPIHMYITLAPIDCCLYNSTCLELHTRYGCSHEVSTNM